MRFVTVGIFIILSGCQAIEKRNSVGARKIVKDVPLNQQLESGTLKKRLMILPIIDTKKILPDEVNQNIKLSFIKELNKTQDVIAFDSLDMKISQLKINNKGQFDLKEILSTLNQYSVHSALEAQVIDIKIKKSAPTKGLIKSVKTQYECQVAMRVINHSGKELFNTLKTVNFKDDEGKVDQEVSDEKGSQILVSTLVKDTFFEFVPQIAKSLETVTWEGRIAAVQGERIFLNVGKMSGLNMGDLLRVVDEGEEIYDTESGQFIGKSPGRLKGTLEVVSFFGQDGAIAVIHSGGGFKENDRVEFY